MKKWIAILTIVCLALSLFAGCKTVDQEEGASSDAYVEQMESDDVQGDGPVKVDPDQTDIDSNRGDEGDEGDEGSEGGEDEKNPSKPDDEKPSGDSDNKKDPADKDPADDKGDEGEEGEEDDKPKEEIDYSDWITVCSYNLRSMQQMDQGIIANLKKIDADIVGLQEVEAYTKRAPGNQVEILAKELGYDYWHFCPCMDWEGNGPGTGYGTGFLSRYPIKEVKDVAYTSFVGSEVRKYSRAVLNVDGKDVSFYNTHLTTGTWSETGIQFKELMGNVYKEKGYVIVTGDFNLDFDNQKTRVDTAKILPLMGLKEMEIKHPLAWVDNIFVSHNMDHFYDEQTGTGVIIIDDLESSDHRPIYSYVKLK